MKETTRHDEQDIKARLDRLGDRLDKVQDRSGQQESTHRQSAYAQRAAGQAWRIAIELAVAIILGALFGYWLDQYFGTTPWLMLVFFVLGIFAGFFNVLRTAKQMQKDAERSGAFDEAKDLPPGKDDDDDW